MLSTSPCYAPTRVRYIHVRVQAGRDFCDCTRVLEIPSRVYYELGEIGEEINEGERTNTRETQDQSLHLLDCSVVHAGTCFSVYSP